MRRRVLVPHQQRNPSPSRLESLRGERTDHIERGAILVSLPGSEHHRDGSVGPAARFRLSCPASSYLGKNIPITTVRAEFPSSMICSAAMPSPLVSRRAYRGARDWE